jgi:hypothetical protein
MLNPNSSASAAATRNGFPLLVHMIFKGKGAFLRHHLNLNPKALWKRLF